MRKMTVTVVAALSVAVTAAGCGDEGDGTTVRARPPTRRDLGVTAGALSPTVDNPYVAFTAVTRAVYEGEEVDGDTGKSVGVRVESTVRDETIEVAGIEVTVVDVREFENGELVEVTEDYYAQHESGDAYYMGERVDDYEDGKLTGHHGEWLAGEDGNRAGVFMPASPEVGAIFEQERAPGVAEDTSTVVASGITVTVPAGTFEDCIETEDYDPIGDVTEHKFYCRDVGLVRELPADGGSVDLVELDRAA